MVVTLALATLAAPVEEVIVEGEALEGTDPASTHGVVTVVRASDATGTDDVASVLASVPGAAVRRLGGLGELATVTVRGSAARQVTVLLDGIPLNPEGSTAIDLAELPLRAFDRVEVWRSGAPPSLGVTGAGGAVNLVTGTSPRSRLAVSGGAWGTGRAHGSAAGPLGRGDGFIATDLLSTRGDFRFLDDGGTPYTVIDDRLGPRLGNDTTQLTLHGRLRAHTGPVRWTALTAGLLRDEGVPGLSWAQTPGVRYQAWRDLSALQADGEAGAVTWNARAWGWLRAESLDDRQGRIGLGERWTLDRSSAVGGSGGVLVAPSSALSVDAALSGRRERWQGRDRLTETDGPPAGRTVSTAALALTARQGPITASPEVRGVHLDPGDAPSTTVGLPRLGLRADLRPITLKASGGAAFRPPDLFELYGDRAVTQGNPDLQPERSMLGDVGIVLAVPRFAMEAACFASASRDRITWTRNGQGVARAENVARALTTGVELGVTVQTAGLAWRTSATHTVARDRDAGTALPWIPVASAWSEVAASLGPFRLTPSASLAAGTWRDRANVVRDPPRLLLGTAAEWRSGPWSVELDVRNLLDTIAVVAPIDPLDARSPDAVRPLSDFQGFPLPGRTWLLTVELAQ